METIVENPVTFEESRPSSPKSPDQKPAQALTASDACPEHAGELYRHVCKTHNRLLCPKCLVKHRQCDFITANEAFAFDQKNKLRNLFRNMNLSLQRSIALRKRINIATDEVRLFKEQNVEMINFAFGQLLIEVEKRKKELIG